MKKLSVLLTLAVALLSLPSATVRADASQNGCENSDYQAKGCANPINMPEPSTFAFLAAGLAVVGGLAVAFRQKRLTRP